MAKAISNANKIQLYLHCAMCLEGKYQLQMLEVGWTAIGLQVWCKRHDANVLHVDFQGKQHPANTSRKAQRTPVDTAELLFS